MIDAPALDAHERFVARTVAQIVDIGDPDLRWRCSRVVEENSLTEVGAEAVEELAAGVRAFLRLLHERALSHGGGVSQSPEGGFWLDGVIADVVAETGSDGRARAARIRDQSRSTWERSGADVGMLVRYAQMGAVSDIANAVWHDIVEPQVRSAPGVEPSPAPVVVTAAPDVAGDVDEAEDETVDRLVTPALPAPFHEVTREAFFTKTRSVRSGEVRTRGKVVAVLEPSDGIQVPEDIGNLLKSTRSVVGHLLVRWLVAAVFDRTAQGLEPYTRITVEGGFQGLAAELGFKGARAADAVRKALTVIRLSSLVVRGIRFAGLCMWTEWAAAPGRRSKLTIHVADWARPGYVRALAQSEREMRMLVPLPLGQTGGGRPLFVGHESHYASQMEMQFAFMVELRHRARELAEHGSVAFSREAWARLANSVELPLDLVDEVLAAWKQGGTDAEGEEFAPFITEPEPGHYSLAEAYAQELRLLVEGGQRSIRGVERRLRVGRPKSSGRK